jgi:hypothetical protein
VTELERRYRRLLASYPRDHREQHGEEMLGVLMAGAGERSRPGWGESVDLLWSAARLHVRRVAAVEGALTVRDVLAIVSLLGPVAMLAGATTAVHELAWWVQAGGLFDLPWRQQIPDAPVWAVWLAVAVLSLFRLRWAAAVGAWLGTAGLVLLVVFAPSYHGWTDVDAGWVLLGVTTAVALTVPSGPARGRELTGRSATTVMVWGVIGAVVLGTVFGESLSMAVFVVGAVAACGRRSRVGRGAALVLLMPVMTTVVGAVSVSVMYQVPTAVLVAVFYGVPVLVLLVLGGLSRRIGRREKATKSAPN